MIGTILHFNNIQIFLAGIEAYWKN